MNDVKQNEKALQKRDKAYDHVFSIVLGIVVIVVGFYMYHFHDHQISLDPDDWGVFGDFIGGALNPLLAFFSFMLLLLNLKLQREQLDNAAEQLKINRRELELTRTELSKAADAQIYSSKLMNEQLKTQSLQQFDSLFSTLISELSKKIDHLYPSNVKELNVKVFKKYESNKNKRQLIIDDHNFSVFFIFLYQLLKLIDTSLTEKITQKKYANIVRSLIPDEILQLLMMNCYLDTKEHNFDNYKKILEKFEFFEHISLYVHKDILKTSILLSIFGQYDSKAFGQNKSNKILRNSVLFTKLKTDNVLKLIIEILIVSSLISKESVSGGSRFKLKEYSDIYLDFSDIQSDVIYEKIQVNTVLVIDLMVIENKILLKTDDGNCFEMEICKNDKGELELRSLKQCSIK